MINDNLNNNELNKCSCSCCCCHGHDIEILACGCTRCKRCGLVLTRCGLNTYTNYPYQFQGTNPLNNPNVVWC